MEKKKHFHLVAGQLSFTHPQMDGQQATINLNAVLQTDKNQIRHRELGQAQQLLQLLFFKKMEDEQFQVQDVFIMGISYMGHMTDKEFMTAPDGEQQKAGRPTPIASELN